MAYNPPDYMGAQQLVNAGWEYFQGKSNQLLSQVNSQLEGIAAPLLRMTAPVITYTPPVFEDGTFVRPVAPTVPTVAQIDATIPSAPVLSAITQGDLPAAPAEPDFGGLAYRQPAAPNIAVPNRPADTDVALVEITIPDAPEFVMPTDPVLYALDMPAIGDLTIPEFTGTRPTLNLDAPSEGLNWSYSAYDDTQVNTIKAQLSSMVLNGLALPPAIESAIFDRARGREDMLALQQEREAERALANRGLRQPAGLLFKAMDALRARARLASSGASRDLGIEIARQNIESIKFGLSQAIALESTLLQQHVAVQGLILDAAKATHSALIEVFNGQVALHNAQWEGYKAEASVYETRIRAIAQEVEIVKARIEAEKVKGDINESLVRAFGEKVRSLSALADMHRAQVEAAKAQGEINVQRLEQVRLRLQAYGIDVDAYAKQWDAYAKQAEAEATGIRYYEALGNVYGARVSAWRGQVEAQNTRVQSQIAVNGQLLDGFRATLAGIQTRVQAQSTNAEVQTRLFSAQVGAFGTEGQVSAAESAAADRTAGLQLEQSKLTFEAAARNAQVAGDFAIKRAELAIEGSRGAAAVWGQLTASVLSGVNLGASTSHGESMSWSWSGEI